LPWRPPSEEIFQPVQGRRDRCEDDPAPAASVGNSR
jgi:hypothetical protein